MTQLSRFPLILFLAAFLFSPVVGWGAPPRLAEELCQKVKAKLQREKLELRRLEVPVSYAEPDGAKLSVAYWVRGALDPSKKAPPLLLIHGGPVGASDRFLDWELVFRSYPGEIVGLDVRGDSCSSELASGHAPEAYRHLRARNIVRDLERLRVSLYGASVPWRVFGQSRGSVVGHYYLEMFPQAIESLHLHGYGSGSADYSRIRSFFSARASNRFAEKFPAAASALRKLKAWLESGPVCFQVSIHENRLLPHAVCGQAALDALSFNLVSQTGWPGFARKLANLESGDDSVDFGVNAAVARAYLQMEIEKNTYVGHFNYIVGTNGQDMGHPNPGILTTIDEDPYIREALICEGRFIGKAMLPWYASHYGAMYSSAHDALDQGKILSSLQSFERANRKKFVFNLYASENDPVAGPEAFTEEREKLGAWVSFRVLWGSAHEGWLTDSLVAEELLRL